MVTKSDCMNARHRDEFHHVSECNSDGTPLRVRVNGMCKTWKTRPTEFRLPVKYGLYGYHYIDHTNCHLWNLGD